MEATLMSAPSQPIEPETAQKRSISEVISDTFPVFDRLAVIVEPYDNENKRDAEFHEKLSEMIIELMLEFHAWAASRPAQESNTAADNFEKEVNAIAETEKEQERTRQRLSEFVDRIKMALAALTGI